MRNKTRSVARSMIVAILTALAALVIGMMSSLTTAVTASIGLSAFKAIIVPGTGTPDPYAADRQNYLPTRSTTTSCLAGGCALRRSAAVPQTPTASSYYATFWPIPLPGWGGLEGQKWNVSVANGVENLEIEYTRSTPVTPSVTIFGYSQGATVANIFKAAHPQHRRLLPRP